MDMRTLVIGGTGFIGYHIVQQLQAELMPVRVLCRKPDKARAMLGDAIEYHQGDLDQPDTIDTQALFSHISTVIYAAGIDERQAPDTDPYTFFYRENVQTCIRFLHSAKQAGVARILVMGSVFSHINDCYPEMQLAHHHPYIRSRVEQKKQALALADNRFTVNVIEIPFVFGSTPWHESIWKTLVNYVRIGNPLVAVPGGTNAMSVTTLAQAITGVIKHVNHSKAIPVGDQNIDWVDLLKAISAIVNKAPKKINQLNTTIFYDLTRIGAFFQEIIGVKSGLDHHRISELITLQAFLDTDAIKQELHYQGGDLTQALQDTVNVCPENIMIGQLQRYIDWFNESSQQTRHFFDALTKPPRP